MAREIQLRRGLAATWTSSNPVLAEGEVGVETDTLKAKVGDGTTAWTSLSYGISPTSVRTDSSDEYSEASEKVTAAAGDRFLIEDSAASYAKKWISATNLPAGVDTTAIHKATAAEISAITQKVTPTGADYLLIEDAADSDNKKYVLISSLPTGADPDAIHDNVNNEIQPLTSKASPVAGDALLLEDSEASNSKKKLLISNLPGGVDTTAIHKATAAEISAITEKTTPVGADLVLIEDSAAANAKKRVQLSNLGQAAVGLFSITKNGDQQTTSITYVDVVTWNTPTVNTAGVTVNSGAGTFTLPAGTWEIHYNLTNKQTTGANRNFSNHHLVLDGTEIPGTYGQTYNRNTTDGATHVACSVIITVTASQVVKLQFNTDNVTYGQTVLANSCAITMKKWA